MEKSMKMPRLGVNDEYVTLVEWKVTDGAYVKQGQTVAEIETTKESSELEAEAEGYIHLLAAADTEIRVAETVAVITDAPEYRVMKEKKDFSGIKITEKARALIEKYNVDLAAFGGCTIVREKDVLALVNRSETVERSRANDVVIVCGGGLAKMTIDLIRLNKAYNIHGFVDDNPRVGPELMGVPYLGGLDKLKEIRSEGYKTAVNANGSIAIDNQADAFHRRERIYEQISQSDYFLPTLIHPSAQIAPSAQLGEGVLVFENAVIGSDAVVGDDCIINTGAIVSHDCVIGNHTRVSPGAILAGDVHVGENSLIGMGVTIYLGVRIGKNVIISNGQNIMGDIPDNTVVK